MGMDRVRFAVVGVTGYSKSHLSGVQFLAGQGRGELVASMMIDRADHPDVVAGFEADGVRVFDDYQTMLDACVGQVDVVTLPVPIHLHAPMAMAAFERGYHVVVEKPVTGGSLSEIDALIAARDAAGRRCAVGFQAIYSPLWQTLKRYAIAGKLGRIKWVRGMALWPRSPAYYARNGWAGRLYVGDRPVFDSPFNNALAHQIMNMLFVVSPEPYRAAYIDEVAAELFRAYPIESFDSACLRARTRDGVEIYFAASHACDVNVNPMIHLEAERATVDYVYGQGATISCRDGATETLSDRAEPRSMVFENLVDVLTCQAETPACPLEMARAHVACIEALHRAAPIVDIAARHIAKRADGQLVVAGVVEAVRQGFETGKLFSELGAPFAP